MAVNGDHLRGPGSDGPSAHEALGMCDVGGIECRLARGKECPDTPAEHIGRREQGEPRMLMVAEGSFSTRRLSDLEPTRG